MTDQSTIDALISNPTEGLNTELKGWIDPTQPEGIAKIAKAALALRNRNGGNLVIGFDDKTRQPDLKNEPANARGLFSIDTIQGIVSKYAFERFEVEIAWGKRDGREYPIILVPAGITIPVAAKRDLLAADGKTLIRENAIYVRTLSANGTPSTAEAKAADWRAIFDICFDNREADIGRFFRRHLPGVDPSSLLKLVAPSGLVVTPGIPTLRDRAVKLLEIGEERYKEELKSRKLSPDEQALLRYGTWSAALVIDPPHADALPDQNFSAIIGASNPNYTGWPVWLDARFNSDKSNQPKRIRNAVEYLIVSLSNDFSNHVDFARLDPKGEFFLHRLLQDDGVPSRVVPGKALDPILMILRVAEVIGVGIAFAKGLGWTPEQTKLGFAFRWTGLNGRRLTAWSRPLDTLEGGNAHDDQIDSYVEFSLDTPLSAVGQFVAEATKELFVAFDGKTVPLQTVEGWVNRLYERKLLGS
jgi:hypothetical protein